MPPDALAVPPEPFPGPPPDPFPLLPPEAAPPEPDEPPLALVGSLGTQARLAPHTSASHAGAAIRPVARENFIGP